jgi:hypothetical protein
VVVAARLSVVLERPEERLDSVVETKEFLDILSATGGKCFGAIINLLGLFNNNVAGTGTHLTALVVRDDNVVAPALKFRVGKGGVTEETVTRGANVPLPFFYTRDSGVALPTAALPYNDIKIQVSTRNAHELLCGWSATGLSDTQIASGDLGTSGNGLLCDTTLTNSKFECWCNYVVVSNDERSKMGAGPRDMVVEQTQKVDRSEINLQASQQTEVEKLFSFNHTVKALFWSLQNSANVKTSSYHSNYTATSPDVNSGFVLNGVNPSDNVTLKYDNTERFTLGADFFGLVQPFYFANKVPSGNQGASPVGYNMYSYALNPASSDPSGSTNIGKLTKVGRTRGVAAGRVECV